MTTTTPTTDRLRAHLAWLREQEYAAHQELLTSRPYTSLHVQLHGDWCEIRGRIKEVERQLREEG